MKVVSALTSLLASSKKTRAESNKDIIFANTSCSINNEFGIDYLQIKAKGTLQLP